MMSTVAWQEWGDEAVAEARRLSRPILLVVTAAWCRHSRALVRLLEEDPAIAAMIVRDYVAIQVDKDKRPDLDARFNLGGWPTLACLTSGQDLIAGGTSLRRDDVERLLTRVAFLVRDGGETIAERLQLRLRDEAAADRAKARRSGELTDELVEKVQGAIVDEFDPEHGGFGTGQKFPHNDAIDFALLRFVKTGSKMLRDVCETTLSKIAESPLHDIVDGGFFRFSKSRDWRSPNTEKLLETNVGLLRNYLEAYQTFERPEYRKSAEKILRYLKEQLRHPTLPAFGGSQDADDGYYAASAAERPRMQPPKVDWTIYVNWNAAAVSALFKASAVLGDSTWRDLAEQTLTFLLEECYDPGRGMYHYHDGIGRHLQGLLADQTYTARALLHAAQYTGERRYLDIAEDLLGVLLHKQVGPQGGFFDVRADAEGPGALRRRNQSILENGQIAEVFLRAHYLTQMEPYLTIAERTLKMFAADYHQYGYYTAGYARAVDLLLHPPVHALIVGPRASEATAAMVKTAAKIYLPSKLVQVIDPTADADLLERFELPGPSAGEIAVAYVTIRRAHLARETTPEGLAAAMTRAGRESAR
jgi:uncharacterized protein